MDPEPHGCAATISRLAALLAGGSDLTYGTWSGIHTATGKEFKLKSYHPMAFKDGQIIGGGDYFDFGGFMASFDAVSEESNE